jgi:hypothetical protein
MPELIDPTIGDEWKCVIIDAYSNANPQVAAEWSANLTDWGTFLLLSSYSNSKGHSLTAK